MSELVNAEGHVLGECRFCGCSLMSQSVICLVCYQQHWRKCNCDGGIICVVEDVSGDVVLGPSANPCKRCHGKGYYLDEAPSESVPNIGT